MPLRETSSVQSVVAELSNGLVSELQKQGYAAIRGPAGGVDLLEQDGYAYILVQVPYQGRIMSVCTFVIFRHKRKMRWYRVIDHNRIADRNHLIALSRASAIALVWARKNGVLWSPKDSSGRPVRPLGEVQ